MVLEPDFWVQILHFSNEVLVQIPSEEIAAFAAAEAALTLSTRSALPTGIGKLSGRR